MKSGLKSSKASWSKDKDTVYTMSCLFLERVCVYRVQVLSTHALTKDKNKKYYEWNIFKLVFNLKGNLNDSFTLVMRKGCQLQ